MKTPLSKLFQEKYLFPGGRNYLLVNKYWGSSYLPVNNYWGVLFSGEYLLTVTPVSLIIKCFFAFVCRAIWFIISYGTSLSNLNI